MDEEWRNQLNEKIKGKNPYKPAQQQVCGAHKNTHTQHKMILFQLHDFSKSPCALTLTYMITQMVYLKNTVTKNIYIAVNKKMTMIMNNSWKGCVRGNSLSAFVQD
jgi:hypothetical protein